jgi:hypothetical protein
MPKMLQSTESTESRQRGVFCFLPSFAAASKYIASAAEPDASEIK